MVKGKRAESEPKKGKGRPKGSLNKPKAPKTSPDAPGAHALIIPEGSVSAVIASPGVGHNSRLTDGEERELFGRHRTIWNSLNAKQKLLDEQWSRAKADIKADGFKVLHMNIADSLINPKGEKRVHGEVRDRLWVARMIGHALGRQFDLFEAPDRTPAIDRAYEEGRTASIENKPRQCTQYHETTEQFREFMRGYNDHQEELIARVGTGGAEIQTPAQASELGAVEFDEDGNRIPSDYVAVDTATANVVSREEFRNRLQGSAREVDAGIKEHRH